MSAMFHVCIMRKDDEPVWLTQRGGSRQDVREHFESVCFQILKWDRTNVRIGVLTDEEFNHNYADT